ncbi:MAG TPA: DHH family phosphoesterase [Solirubrobacteraceae bacterium]|nr:DHH family phosphoesterase [Solirubrobacteraceae bacterium]
MSTAAAGTREQVLDAVRSNDRFLLVTHENPDGDALGSLVAMHAVLRLLGKEAVMFIAAEEFPLPYEYRFFDLDGAVTEVPHDLSQRVVVFLDCGNIDRAPEELRDPGLRILNVDHHHDNTRFGTLDHIVPEASCTAEIVWDLMRSLGVEATPDIADALYVGLVTDTGRFMYENTGTRAHVMAAELIEAGVDVHAIYRRLYEGVPYAKLRLLALALGAVRRFDGGRLTLSRLTREHFAEAKAEDSYSEGIVDHLRGVEGTKVAALVRELVENGGSDGAAPRRAKVSLRAADPAVDVSAIARAGGGGGHRQAAGFTTQLADDELIAFLRDAIAAQLAALPDDRSSR